ncbi:MAG: hypothetical protein AB7F43_07010 [Bacteriovoracia bacterium]
MAKMELLYLLGLLERSVSEAELSKNKKLPRLMALMKQKAAELSGIRKEQKLETRGEVFAEQSDKESR